MTRIESALLAFCLLRFSHSATVSFKSSLSCSPVLKTAPYSSPICACSGTFSQTAYENNEHTVQSSEGVKHIRPASGIDTGRVACFGARSVLSVSPQFRYEGFRVDVLARQADTTHVGCQEIWTQIVLPRYLKIRGRRLIAKERSRCMFRVDQERTIR